jgi:protein involved in polysaccharide export with SLBB domain
MKPFRFFLLVFLGALSASRNTLWSAQSVTAEPGVPTSLSTANTSTVVTAVVEGRLGIMDDKHKLAPGDKVSFRIVEDNDPIVQLVVADSGELEVPYIGRVKCAAKTCKAVALEVKRLLEQDYYYHADVRIGLDAVSKVRGRVWCWGQVRNQGPVEIPTEENFTVSKAISRANGFGDFADKKRVKLIRTMPDGTQQTEVMDMQEIFDKGKMEKDKVLQDGDIVLVPEKLFNF